MTSPNLPSFEDLDPVLITAIINLHHNPIEEVTAIIAQYQPRMEGLIKKWLHYWEKTL